jgi:DNA-binding protein HU-beta
MAAHVNKDALVSEISTKTELSKKDIEMVIDTLTEIILTGFGTFRVSKRAAREGINPQTKERLQIPAMSVPKFTAGKALKEAVR